MTVLFGDTNFSAYTASGPSSLDGAYVSAAPFIATSGGRVTSLYAYLTPSATCRFVMAVYDAQFQRLAYSAPITVSSGGLIQFPIAPLSVTLFQAYQIVLIPIDGVPFSYGLDDSMFSGAFKIQPGLTGTVPAFQLVGPQPVTFGSPVFFADGDTQAQTLQPSGKIGETVMDTATVISLAFRRAKIRPNVVSDEMIEVARQELFLLLTGDLANRGTQLFAIDTQLLPMTAGRSELPMPPGTVDVLNANYRYLTAFQAGNSLTFSPISATQVTTVGLKWGAPGVPFLIQVSDDNFSWRTLRAEAPNASAGDVTLYDLDGGGAALFWQVVPDPTAPLGTLPLTLAKVTFYGTFSQTPMAPYSRDDFANLSNTFFGGRPFQYWLDRQDPWPIMRLWPTPQVNDQDNACIILWRKRQIMDVGALSDRLNVPNRWLTAVIDMLAARLGASIDEVPPALIQILEARATVSLNKVREEERENAPMRITPAIRCYTR